MRWRPPWWDWLPEHPVVAGVLFGFTFGGVMTVIAYLQEDFPLGHPLLAGGALGVIAGIGYGALTWAANR